MDCMLLIHTTQAICKKKKIYIYPVFIAGSAAPGPVPEGLIRVYSMRFCPFAQRARLVLNAKGIK